VIRYSPKGEANEELTETSISALYTLQIKKN